MIKDYNGNIVPTSVNATTSSPGLMSAADKTKLDNLELTINTFYRKTPKEISYTWAEIKTKCENDDLNDIEVGDYKDITLTTGEKVRMEVAGINCYKGQGVNTIIDNHIDFISRNCLETPRRLHSSLLCLGSYSEGNPFKNSELYNYINTTLYNQLPSDLKSVIIEKIQSYERRVSGGANDIYFGSYNKIWLPSEFEITGKYVYSKCIGGESNHVWYPIFMNQGRRIKGKGFNDYYDDRGRNRIYWWTSSISGSSNEHYCYIDNTGNIIQNKPTVPIIAYPLCFRIGVNILQG